MNERQRDLFLYVWSRRRKPGQLAVGLRGAAIGAIGGLVFIAFMFNGGHPAGSEGASLGEQMGTALGLLAMSVGAFGLIGWVGANRVYAQNERMYEAILDTGAKVPEQKPVMQMADRWPAIMVGVTVVIIAGFIIALFIAYYMHLL